MKKKFERLRDGVEDQRIAAQALFCECESEMESLPMAQLVGEEGVELAALMDALILAHRALSVAKSYMDSVGKAG